MEQTRDDSNICCPMLNHASQTGAPILSTVKTHDCFQSDSDSPANAEIQTSAVSASTGSMGLEYKCCEMTVTSLRSPSIPPQDLHSPFFYMKQKYCGSETKIGDGLRVHVI